MGKWTLQMLQRECSVHVCNKLVHFIELGHLHTHFTSFFEFLCAVFIEIFAAKNLYSFVYTTFFSFCKRKTCHQLIDVFQTHSYWIWWCATLYVLIEHNKRQSTSTFDTHSVMMCFPVTKTIYHFSHVHMFRYKYSTNGVFIWPSCSHSFIWFGVVVCAKSRWLCVHIDVIQHIRCAPATIAWFANGNSTTYPSSIYATYNKHLHIIRIERYSCLLPR